MEDGTYQARDPRPRLVIDTNVLVSALLSPGRTAAKVISLVSEVEAGVLFDARITDEYWKVLRRPRFGFGDDIITALIERMTHGGEHISARPIAATLPDSSDLPFAEVAVAGRADALVTGNARHFAPVAGLVRVLSPRDLLTELRGEG